MLIKIKWVNGLYAKVEREKVELLLERPTRGISITRGKEEYTRPPSTGIVCTSQTIEVPFDLATTQAILDGVLDENGEVFPYNGEEPSIGVTIYE